VSQAKQLEIAKDVEKMRLEMAQKQVGSKLNLLEAQASRLRIEQDLTDTVNRGAEVTHDLQSKEAERQAFIDEWRHQILDQLVAARTEATKASEGMSKASLIKDLVVLTAPEDGVVLEVIRRGVGSVVREAEPIVTVVQSSAKLEGEITINSADIGYIQPGDEVVVKVDAFPYQRHGFLHGKLASISEESFATNGSGPDGVVPKMPMGSEEAGAFHRGRVEFESTKLEELPEGARLIPGMTLRAEIKVGKRSVLSYFLNPITRVFGESIREP
jgi:HlyD family secretion protein